MATDAPNTLKSSEKLLRIVDELSERGEAGVTELANATSVHKSTVYVHLQTMKEEGIVAKSDKQYRLSLKFLTISERIRNHRPVYRVGHGEVDSLAKETGELVCLGLPENGETVIVYTASGQKASQTMSVGARVPMFDSPMGKVLLASLVTNRDELEEQLSGEDMAVSESGTVRTEEMLAELAAIREDGFSVSDDQSVDGIPYIAEPELDKPRSESHRANITNRAIAAPVFHDDEPVGAIGVTGPSKRISGEYCDHLREQVVQTAATIEKKLDINAPADQ